MTPDPGVLRHSFAIVERRADRMAKYFYAHLFREHPGVRGLFPDDMADQRDRLFGALTAAVAHVDDPDVLVPFLRALGADHRRFGALAAHYPAVGASLVATVRTFSGEAWSDEAEAAWTAAYRVISEVMIDAARRADAAGEPAVWHAKVVRRERPAPTVATLTLQVGPEYPFRAGQYLSLTLNEREVRNVWRQFSIANAPRPDTEAYLAGPPGMVGAARAWLAGSGGLPAERIRYDAQPEEHGVTRPLTPADWFLQRPPVPWIRRPGSGI